MPSKKVLQEKQEIVSGLTNEFKNAKSIVFAEYRGLTVAQDTEMRAAMRKAGIRYQVIKNTLSSRALKDAGIEGADELAKGPTAIAYSKDDVVAPAKVIKQYADKYEKFSVKGGVMDGKVISLDVVKQLASIPSREVLYGQIVCGLITPIASLAMILNAISEKANEQGATTVAAIVANAAPAPAAE